MLSLLALGLLAASLLLAAEAAASCPEGCVCEDVTPKPGDQQQHYMSAKCTGLDTVPDFSRKIYWWKIELTGGNMASLPIASLQGLSVTRLDLSNNQIQELEAGVFSDVAALYSLKLEFNSIKMLDRDVLRGLNDLTLLRLRDNRISYLHPEALTGLSSLKELDLTNNLLSAVPTSNLQDVRALKILRLIGNKISEVKGWAFDGLRLETLDLSNNIAPLQLSEHSFCGLEPIYQQTNGTRLQLYAPKAVALDNNGLQHLSPCGDTIINSFHLGLAGNPMVCDCDLLYLRDMGTGQKSGFPQQCSGPRALQGRRVLSLQQVELGCSPAQTLRQHGCLDSAAFCKRAPQDLAQTDADGASGTRTGYLVLLLVVLAAVCV